MIYRFSTFTRSKNFQGLETKWNPVPAGIAAKFFLQKDDLERESIACCGPSVEIFKAPLLGKWSGPSEWVIDLKLDCMLDIFMDSTVVYVSEATKNIINKVDPNTHQFLPVRIFKKSGEEVVDQSYFTLLIRRFVNIVDEGRALNSNFQAKRQYTTLKDEEFLLGIEHRPEIMKCLDSFPLWRPLEGFLKFYLNEELLTEFHEAGLTGFDFYTRRGGVKEQTVCAVFQK